MHKLLYNSLYKQPKQYASEKERMMNKKLKLKDVLRIQKIVNEKFDEMVSQVRENGISDTNLNELLFHKSSIAILKFYGVKDYKTRIKSILDTEKLSQKKGS